jgi:hypothetical protein
MGDHFKAKGGGNMSRQCKGTMIVKKNYGRWICNKCGGEDLDTPFLHVKGSKKPCIYEICERCGKRTFPTGPCKC